LEGVNRHSAFDNGPWRVEANGYNQVTRYFDRERRKRGMPG